MWIWCRLRPASAGGADPCPASVGAEGEHCDAHVHLAKAEADAKAVRAAATPARDVPPAHEPLDPVDAAQTFAVLDSHDVRYVVIGGFAVQIHGVEGFAPTADTDITPATDDANLDRLAAALRELEAQLSYRAKRVDVVVPINRQLFKDRIRVTFLTRHGRSTWCCAPTAPPVTTTSPSTP